MVIAPSDTPIPMVAMQTAVQVVTETEKSFAERVWQLDRRVTELVRDNAVLGAENQRLLARVKQLDAQVSELKRDADKWQSLEWSAEDIASQVRIRSGDFDAESGREIALVENTPIKVLVADDYVARQFDHDVEIDGETVQLRFTLQNHFITYNVAVKS